SVNDGDWTVNPDGTMDVTWKLKPNLTWHDGAPLTSADVAFGYQMYLDPELPVQRTGGVELVSDIATPDPLTVVVHWKQAYYNPNVSLASLFAGDLDVIPEALTESDREAIATRQDTFRLVQWPTSTTGAIWQWRDANAAWVGDANNATALKVRQAMMMLLDRQ